MPPDNFEENEIQAQYKALSSTRDKAYSDRQLLIKTANLTERQVINRRACKDDKRSMQFICTEKKMHEPTRSQEKIGMHGQRQTTTSHIDNKQKQ